MAEGHAGERGDGGLADLRYIERDRGPETGALLPAIQSVGLCVAWLRRLCGHVCDRQMTATAIRVVAAQRSRDQPLAELETIAPSGWSQKPGPPSAPSLPPGRTCAALPACPA